MKVWITRARPGAEATAARLAALGYSPLIAPLLEVRYLSAEIDLWGVQALAFTSTNGVAAFTTLTPDRLLPVLTVGDATARAAREAGFADVRSADGDLIALAALIRTGAVGLSILHPCAAEPAGDLAAEVGDAATVRSIPVYGTQETNAAPPETWDAVLIHSPRAARALSADATGRIAVAISPAAAAPLSALGFEEVRIASAPTEAALLAALGNPGPDV
jgi:uroporphyrinogen-III synthase